MVPKKLIKFVNGLQIKKYRIQEQSFVVEGAKSVLELINSNFEISHLFASSTFLQQNRTILNKRNFPIYEANEKELESMGTFKTNQAALAVAKIPRLVIPPVKPGDFCLALDDIRDPGNLGTIIRIADWYGIQKIYCSDTCVDVYNPKVVSASMGSFLRVGVFYVDLESTLANCPLSVYGAFLDGENIHSLKLKPEGIIIIGNESVGIGGGLANLVSQRIQIPRFGLAESLNAGIATAVILDNFRRS